MSARPRTESAKTRCDPRKRKGADVSLNVLPTGKSDDAPVMARSRNSRRRAFVLILLHVIIIAHIIQWRITGETVSPVEPSEAMQTLETGAVNAGFIFFAVALLATLIFGRFVCGWGCHIVALQDLCYWMMRKIGVRPKPFRSRLLILAPLALALYMFVWPTVYRVVFTDIPAPSLTNHIMERNFWETFAGPIIAVPFLLICGFATVYFLGAKGFCTYGCPYGGFFAPVDSLSPGRIVVDPDKCEGCGHCTAVCTSNVRVHEEIAVHGMVVDPGCMKCLDCVSVCPNDALSFKMARPAILKKTNKDVPKAKRKFDLTLGEEITFALVLFFSFMAYRNLYGLIPMLMAIGAAGCATYIFYIASRILSDANVRFHQFQLRHKGRVTGVGAFWLTGSLLLALFTLHSGVLKYQRIRGEHMMREVGALVSHDQAFGQARSSIPPEAFEIADRAISHLRMARPIGSGGIALISTPDVDAKLAMLYVVKGDAPQAERLFQSVLEREGMIDQASADLMRTMLMQGRAEDALEQGRSNLAEDPSLVQTRQLCVDLAIERGDVGLATELYEEGAAAGAMTPRMTARLANIYAMTNRIDEALATIDLASAQAPEDHVVFDLRLSALLTLNRFDQAIDELKRKAEAEPDFEQAHLERAAIILRQLGRDDEADALNIGQ